MLKDADPNYFAGIYIVCGYTDLRYGIDSLAAIIEQKIGVQRTYLNASHPCTLQPCGLDQPCSEITGRILESRPKTRSGGL